MNRKTTDTMQPREPIHDWPCKKCGQLKVYVVDDGETFDGADDWYDYLCTACGFTWRGYVEHS